MRVFAHYLLSAGIWTMLVVVLAAQEAQPVGVLTLTNGDSVAGEFRPSATADVLSWQGIAFNQPFEFFTNAVSSVHFPTAKPGVPLQGEIAIELASGDMVTGRLVQWTQDDLELDTPHFGVIHVQPQALRRIYRLTDNPLLVYAGMTGLGDWRTHETEWHEDGPFVETSTDEAMISGDFQIPDQAVIEFEMSWPEKPNFAFVIAADNDRAVDKRDDGWRFEMWDQLLGVLREHADIADVDRVAMILPTIKRIHLIAYLDQVAGSIQVFQADGTPAGAISVTPAADSKPGRGLRLLNRHGTVRLERLRIAHWNGQVPSSIPVGQVGLQVREGTSQLGQLTGFDSTTREFLFVANEAERRIPELDLVNAEWAPPTTSAARPVATMLQDGTRLSGTIEAVEPNRLLLRCPDISDPLPLQHATVRSLVMTVSDDAAASAEPPTEGRLGRLEIGNRNLSGRLLPGTEDPNTHCFNWHPAGSRTGSSLKPGAAGRVVYRESIKVEPNQAQAVPERPGVNFLDIFIKKANGPVAARKVVVEHNIHLRSGDIIPCTVKSIDESGVLITSTITESQLIPHTVIKAIELIRGQMPDLKEAKKQRLLTLPRLQKGSPPTHLLCTETGDFLRCRLVSMNADRLVVEIRLNETELPRDRVSHIIWFHPDELLTAESATATEAAGEPAEAEIVAAPEPDAAVPADVPPLDPPVAKPSFADLAQLIQRSGNRVTFDPQSVDGKTIFGTSDVLGACQFPLEDVDQIVFGDAISLVVADLVYSQWRLHAAIEPLVAQDNGGGGASDMGGASPLVGQPAPEIDLALLEGGRFELSKHKGQIVVLDFWATWCGPCRQTMPLVEEAMQQFDPAQVRLVAVNLEESAEQIRDVMTRLNLHATVALDVDGVAARRYQANAIPQLVIVDADGKVAKLYVGGGPNVAEQLTATLKELLNPTEQPAPDATP